MSHLPDNLLIGDLLRQAHLISPAQLDVALRDQQRYKESNLGSFKLGEILALRGWLRQETADFFCTKWTNLLGQKERQPLGYYLSQASLLSEQQICYLIEEQQKLSMRLRLGELAYLEGWLHPKTVNYFVTSLSTIPGKTVINSSAMSTFSRKKRLLEAYSKGKRDFRDIQLEHVYLQNINLSGIKLDRSLLPQSSLQRVNLSRASLNEVNFDRADLTFSSLRRSSLQRAFLTRANLLKANLQEANLRQANLQHANLKQANLMKSSLEGADLRGAKLQGANLYGAYYDVETLFDSTFNPVREGMVLIKIHFGSTQIVKPTNLII